MRIFSLVLALSLILFPALRAGAEEAASSTLYVRRVENLPDDFIFGMDASIVLAEEASGVRYYSFGGQQQDVFEILAENGITHIRVRVWNNPFDSQGRGFGGGNCDIAAAAEIGRRAAAAGLKLIVDFHYSDFWADPGKQMVPRAWKGMDIEQKTEAVYEYTRGCLRQLLDAGADVGMVQIGNETNQYLCGEKKWFNIQYLMQAGARAVREVCPGALVALHFANPEKADSYASYASKLAYYQVDYDVFATSYYPYWHGSLENLSAVLTQVAETYGKKVMVMETSYAFTGEDTDFFGNTIGEGAAVSRPWPFTVQGQANAVRAVTDTVVNGTPAGIGVVYWEGCWISVGTSSWEENHEKWETFGSGWASSHAVSYDPADAGRYFGGCAVDNQALFDAEGRPLESLRVFRLMREGNELPVQPDALEEIDLICDMNAPVSLPETVSAVMNDDSRRPVPVTWNWTAEQEAALKASAPASAVVIGTAEGGLEARCNLSLVEYNYLSDYSFENGGEGWTWTDLRKADELYVEDKKTDSLTGSKHFHFWSAARDSVEFTLEQAVADLPGGSFRFSVSVMGGDAGDAEVYAYVKINGETAGTAPMAITSYGSWDTGTVTFDHPAGAEVTVGVYVRCSGEGNGAWGKIDDALLNSVR